MTNNYISVEGTGAILRSYSEKNKENNESVGLIMGKDVKNKLFSVINHNDSTNTTTTTTNYEFNFSSSKKHYNKSYIQQNPQHNLINKIKNRSTSSKF